MLVIIIAICIGLIPAAIAHGKGHNFFLWWLFGAALWIVALPCAILLKDEKAAAQQREHARREAAETRPCPSCAEPIKRAASVCRYCGRDVVPLEMTGPEMVAALRAQREARGTPDGP